MHRFECRKVVKVLNEQKINFVVIKKIRVMINEEREFENLKIKKLILGILFDAVGMLSFTIPLVGEFADVIWAPFAGFLMTKMYEGRVGRIAGILTFVEEIIPFTDVIPSFTLTWIYTYLIKKEKIVTKKEKVNGLSFFK